MYPTLKKSLRSAEKCASAHFSALLNKNGRALRARPPASAAGKKQINILLPPEDGYAIMHPACGDFLEKGLSSPLIELLIRLKGSISIYSLSPGENMYSTLYINRKAHGRKQEIRFYPAAKGKKELCQSRS
ncbi:hypothetical protein [Dictyobacter formicarum]|uniref:hypothetical protein n=1 Tax=Dictyobacter formicarum TaxID=2778368 RepID=UPI0019154DD3|nr:hypothetical protein [Dictyobacter formicarum]